MSLAENLLNSLDETAYANTRIASGGIEEEHIVVDASRTITVPANLKTIAVKGDKDIETATIDCVRYWDGHDLSTFAIYLNYILPNGDEGTYIPQSITKSEATFSFDWLIGSEFTYAQGKMTFWIVAKLTDDSGTLIKQWSSFRNSDCTIAQGGDKIYVPEKQTDQDVITQAISISRASAEFAKQQANLAIEVANKAALDASQAAEEEVSRIIGELGVVQELGDSPNSVVSQAKVTKEFSIYNSKITRNSKRITNLEQGVAEQFETDASVAYVKYVPANALPYAEVKKIGGMTYKDGDTLRSAKVERVEREGSNLIDLDLALFQDCKRNGDTIRSNINDSYYSCVILETISDWVLSMRGKAITFSVKDNKGKMTSILVFGTKADGTAYQEASSFARSVTMTISEDFLTVTALELRFNRSYSMHTDTTSVFEELMLNKGTEALPYTPYMESTLPIPEAVRPKNGINENVYDYIEWAEDGSVKQVVRCGVVDLGTLDWSLGQVFFAFIDDKKGTYNVIADNYDTFIGDVHDLPNKSLTTHTVHGSLLYIKDTEYTDAAAFKAAMSGVMLVYELAEPIITDISDLITADNLIGVEGGGTLTFENEYGYAVPSEVEYQVEV